MAWKYLQSEKVTKKTCRAVVAKPVSLFKHKIVCAVQLPGVTRNEDCLRKHIIYNGLVSLLVCLPGVTLTNRSWSPAPSQGRNSDNLAHLWLLTCSGISTQSTPSVHFRAAFAETAHFPELLYTASRWELIATALHVVQCKIYTAFSFLLPNTMIIASLFSLALD